MPKFLKVHAAGRGVCTLSLKIAVGEPEPAIAFKPLIGFQALAVILGSVKEVE
jgi:hypothetical protein